MAIVHKKSTTMSDSIAVWESPDKKWQVNIPNDGSNYYLGRMLGDRLLQVGVSDGWTVHYAEIYRTGRIVEDEMFEYRVPKKVRDAAYSALKRAYSMYGPVKSKSGRGKQPIRFIVKVIGNTPSANEYYYYTTSTNAYKAAEKKWNELPMSKKRAGYWVNIMRITSGPYYSKSEVPMDFHYTPVKTYRM